jgi:hypothetical protein
VKFGAKINLVKKTLKKSCWKIFCNSENLNFADCDLLTLNVTTLLHIVHLLQSFQAIIIIIIIIIIINSVTNLNFLKIIL